MPKNQEAVICCKYFLSSVLAGRRPLSVIERETTEVRFVRIADHYHAKREEPLWVKLRPSAPSETLSAFRPKRDIRL